MVEETHHTMAAYAPKVEEVVAEDSEE